MGELVEMCDKEYFALDRVSSSSLRMFERSREGYKARYVDKIDHDEETPALLIGSAAHALILEGEGAYKSRYPVYPKKYGKSKADEFAKINFEAEFGGGPVCGFLKPSQAQLIGELEQAVKSNSQYQKLMSELSGTLKVEQVVLFERRGFKCKAKLDLVSLPNVLNAGRPVLLDLKTAKNCHPERFKWSFRDWGYAAQMSFYLDAVKTCIQVTDWEVYMIVVGKENKPRVAAVYRVSPQTLFKAHQQNEQTLTDLRQALVENKWESDWVSNVNRL